MTALPTAGQAPNWATQLNTAIEERAVPIGGTSGQALVKQSGTDRDVDWEDVGGGLPVGGTAGQALIKQSGTDGDADWESFTAPVSPMTPVTGQYIRPGISSSNASVALNNMALTPVVVEADVTIDAFLIGGNTTNGSTHEVGLYPSNSNGTPDFSAGPLRSVSGTPFASTASPTLTFTALALTKGIYWFAFRSGGTGPSVRRLASINPLPFIPPGLGWDGVGYNDSGVTSLPSGAFTPTVTASVAALFAVQLRISSVP